ncbi:hypothetical protein HK405_004297 [Cladochytrium tenue]|nr:hypothetical protein HK405_004297 [Cladochytrium tenue]
MDQQQLTALLEQFSRQLEALQQQSDATQRQLAKDRQERQAAQQQLADALQQLAEDRQERQAAQQRLVDLQRIDEERQDAPQRPEELKQQQPVFDFQLWLKEAEKILWGGPVQKSRNKYIAATLEDKINRLGLDVSKWEPDLFVRMLLEKPEDLAVKMGEKILQLAYSADIPERKIFFVKNPKNPAQGDYELNNITVIEDELTDGAICEKLCIPPHDIVALFIEAISQKVRIKGDEQEIQQVRKGMKASGLKFNLYAIKSTETESESAPASSFMALFTESIQQRCNRLATDSLLKEFALDALLISYVVDEFIFTFEGYERNRAVAFPLSYAGNGSVTYIRPHSDISIRKTLYNDVGLNIFLVELKHGKAAMSEVTRDNSKLAFMAAQNLHIAGLCGVATPLSVIPCLQIVGLNAVLYIAYVFEDDTKYCRLFSYDLSRPQHRFVINNVLASAIRPSSPTLLHALSVPPLANLIPDETHAVAIRTALTDPRLAPAIPKRRGGAGRAGGRVYGGLCRRD